MRSTLRRLACLVLASLFALASAAPPAAAQISTQTAPEARWSEAKANAWYARQPWLVGANYIPSDAINELEMFQAATFNPALNDRELGLAESIGMNTARVFLQDQLWEQDPDGFKRRLDAFLTIAARHHIRPLLVLFDSCWEANPHLGPQHPPIPGVHNSGWVQSPGKARLLDPADEPRLKAYVTGIVGAFANDDRILGWDIWNEPDNRGGDTVADEPAKVARVDQLLPLAFAWARSAHPTQPLTSGVWTGNWSDPAKESLTTRIQLTESDVISFHNYGWPEEFEAKIQELQPNHRPILCTEYMARGAGSTFDGSLPIAKKYNVAAITGASSPARPRPTSPGTPGRNPTSSRPPPSGSTRSSARTTPPTASTRSTSSANSPTAAAPTYPPPAAPAPTDIIPVYQELAMRTLVDIPEHDLAILKSISKTENVSRAEVIRRAIAAYIVPRQQKWAGVDAAFGSWADLGEDGVAYQERLRKEWERDENGL